MQQKGYDMQDVEHVEAPVDNWIPPYTIEEVTKKDQWEGSISQDEINALLSVLDKEDPYAQGAVWEHKDGGVYQIIKKEPYILVESINEDFQSSRKMTLVWYKERFSDMTAPVYVRTESHFEKSFKWIPNSDLIDEEYEEDEEYEDE